MTNLQALLLPPNKNQFCRQLEVSPYPKTCRKSFLKCSVRSNSFSVKCRGEDHANARILVSTGDIMGDIHAANLIKELQLISSSEAKDVEIFVVGGTKCKETGATVIGDTTGLSSIGIFEAIPLVIPAIRVLRDVLKKLEQNPPDVVILIDYPVFNLYFGRILKEKFACKIAYYIPPNDWLWTNSRTAAVVEISDILFAVYEKEAEYFQKAGANVVFVGHPLSHLVKKVPSKEEARRSLGLGGNPGENSVTIALIPASRKQEVRLVWPVIARAAKILKDSLEKLGTKVYIFLPVADPSFVTQFNADLRELGLSEETVLWQGDSRAVLSAADIALTKSGSVTAELAFLQIPQVVVYKVSNSTSWFARNVLNFKLPYVSLVNILCDEEVVPEFIQEMAQPELVAAEAFNFLESKTDMYKTDMFKAISSRTGAPKQVAVSIFQFLD